MNKWAIAIFVLTGLLQGEALSQGAPEFQFPLDSHTITQGYLEFYPGNLKPHLAEDLRAVGATATQAGATVRAAGAGTVLFARKWKTCPNWGYVLVIQHDLPDGRSFQTIYGHLDPTKTTVAESDTVVVGQKIGEVGHWINPVDGKLCWGDHLHFGVREGAPGPTPELGGIFRWLHGYAPWPEGPTLAGSLPSYCDPTEFINSQTCVAPRLTYLRPDPDPDAPSSKDGKDGKDIWTTSLYSYTSAGGGPGGGLNDGRLRVGGFGDFYYSLIDFNLTGLPKAASEATVDLYMPAVTGGGVTGLQVDQVTHSWNWTTQGTGSDKKRLWWADKPTSVTLGFFPAPTAAEWYSIGITDLYNAWQAGTTPNHGIELRPNGAPNKWAEFRSSNYEDRSFRPRLVVNLPALHEYFFTGHVTESHPQGADGLGNLALYLPIPPAVGDIYTVSFKFDPSIKDTNPLVDIGTYTRAIHEVTVVVGSNNPIRFFSANSDFTQRNSIRVESSATTFNTFSAKAGGQSYVARSSATFDVSFVLGNAVAGYFSSDALPPTPPDPSVFLAPAFSFSGSGGSFSGSIEEAGRPQPQ